MARKGQVKPALGGDITQYSVAQLRQRANENKARGLSTEQFDRELDERAQNWDDLEEKLGR